MKKAIFNTKELAKALSELAPVATNSMFGDVVAILCDGSRLEITAMNNAVQVTTSVQIFRGDQFEVCINRRIIAETLQNMPDVRAEFILTKGAIKIQWLGGEYSTPLHDCEIKAVHLPFEEKNSLNGLRLKNALTATKWAASNDDLRPAMTAMFFEIKENKLQAVATDASVMSIYDCELANDIELSMLIPATTCDYLAKLLDEGIVSITAAENKATFYFKNYVITATLIGSPYPNWQGVIPAPIKQAILSASDLQGIIKRANIYASKDFGAITVSVGSDSLQVKANDKENGSEFNEVSEIVQGSEMVFTVNAARLLNSLKAIGDEEVRIDFAGENRAIMINRLASISGDNLKVLLMPLKL